MIKSIFIKIAIPCAILLIYGVANSEDSSLEKLFNERNIKGTIIISSLHGQTKYVYDEKRMKKRFLPASTFKIPNTLIALAEKAVVDEKEIIEWDGKDKGWSPWNKDHSLESAFPLSCVWFYQELAQRVGNTNYLDHLDSLNYGNKQTGDELTTFWLNGDLRISAKEQIDFLKKLYWGKLPYEKKHIELLKNMMIVDKKAHYTLRAKTGWAMRIKNQHGWYVGYIETENDVWFFALNVDIKNKNDAAYRKEITMEALKIKAIL